MKLEYRKLSDSEATEALAAAPGWSIEGDKLTRTFTFDLYKGGVEFASAVGSAADQLDHHPDILIGYKKVTVSVNTHDVGGLSPYDFELARRIDSL